MSSYSFKILTLSNDVENILVNYIPGSLVAAKYVSDMETRYDATLNSVQASHIGIDKWKAYIAASDRLPQSITSIVFDLN